MKRRSTTITLGSDYEPMGWKKGDTVKLLQSSRGLRARDSHGILRPVALMSYNEKKKQWDCSRALSTLSTT